MSTTRLGQAAAPVDDDDPLPVDPEPLLLPPEDVVSVADMLVEDVSVVDTSVVEEFSVVEDPAAVIVCAVELLDEALPVLDPLVPVPESPSHPSRAHPIPTTATVNVCSFIQDHDRTGVTFVTRIAMTPAWSHSCTLHERGLCAARERAERRPSIPGHTPCEAQTRIC